MTTGLMIRKKDKIVLAADRKYVGGHTGKGMHNKIHRIKLTDFDYINIICAGISIDEFTLDKIIDSVKKDGKIDRYDLMRCFKMYTNNSDIIVVNGKVEAYRISISDTLDYIEEIDEFCFVGSGSQFGTGIYLYDKNVKLKDLFKTISSFDDLTSSEFDFIEIIN